ncbi:MAG: hypothetical protein LBS90_08380 [Oscillospiraceae bacterium]|jgi:hypothetical protein|nr:hypothetical protein [Oscillospiraceae bacterium]
MRIDISEIRCAYCRFGDRISDAEIGCVKHGITVPEFRCAKFRLDRAKRVPELPRRLDASKYTRESFRLDGK